MRTMEKILNYIKPKSISINLGIISINCKSGDSSLVNM
jgi:hypothetical protein